MTEAEKRGRVAKRGKPVRSPYPQLNKLRDEIARSEDAIAKTLGLSWPAIAWCRANPELVEALAKGTWQAVPKEPTSKILHGRMIEPRYVKAIYIDALAAAPKKPEE